MRRVFLFFLLFLAVSGMGHATSFVMVSDQDLVAHAPVIVEATVTGVADAPAGRPATDYSIRVDRVLKGRAATEVVVRMPGGRASDGRELHIFGSPRLIPGQEVLLFLHPGSEGVWRSLHLMLGTFYRLQVGEQRIAARNFAGTVELGADGTARESPADRGRDEQAFIAWIERRVAGEEAPPDYFVHLSPQARDEVQQKFTHLTSDSVPMRWFEFDRGESVTWRAQSGGQPGMEDGGFIELQQALAAWSEEPRTSIQLFYAGTTGGGAGFSAPDRQNIVHFADPHEDIESPYVCGGGGGVLAIGGPWFSRQLRDTFQGRSFIPILEGDIITNRGIECFLLNNGPRMAELLSHEVGHTLGLGHSCGDEQSGPCLFGSLERDAQMRATVHNDGRGASLRVDDVAAVRFLYATGDDCDGGSARGGEVLCLHGDRFRLEVQWENQFDGSRGSGFAIPSSDLAGFFYFTDPRNFELMVKLLDFGDRVLFFSGQLTNLHFAITVTDTLTGKVKVYTNGPNNCGEIDEDAFPSLGATGAGMRSASAALLGAGPVHPGVGIPHDAPLRPRRPASGAPGTLDLQPRPEAFPKAAGSCQPGSHRLCLLEGRVAAELTWRNQFNDTSGIGLAEPLSDLTGSFSFDDPANLEVLIKALDFGGTILVLWGSLSNLEYAIQVTDTLTGASNRYENPAGTYCGGLDQEAF